MLVHVCRQFQSTSLVLCCEISSCDLNLRKRHAVFAVLTQPHSTPASSSVCFSAIPQVNPRLLATNTPRSPGLVPGLVLTGIYRSEVVCSSIFTERHHSALSQPHLLCIIGSASRTVTILRSLPFVKHLLSAKLRGSCFMCRIQYTFSFVRRAPTSADR